MNYNQNKARSSGAGCGVLSLGLFRGLLSSLDMKKLKMWALALVGLGALPVLAEGETASANAIDQIGAKIATEIEGWTTSITSFFVDNSTAIFTILGIAVGVSLIWVVFKFFRKGTNKVG